MSLISFGGVPTFVRGVYVLVVVCAVALVMAIWAPLARADASHLARVEPVSAHEERLFVYSAAMGRVIEQDVLLATDRTRPHPTLYLLNGTGGADEELDWQAKTDVTTYFADKNVDVVIPRGGSYSYYTDWQADDPVLGRNKWTTYLTRELPAIADATLHSTGTRAIVGVSMSGTSVLSLAESAPGLFRAVAALSGCAATSTLAGQAYIILTTEIRGGGDVTNMWGPLDGPGWAANDPDLHADRLRGITIYLASGTGLPGGHDRLAAANIAGNPYALANQVVQGGVIEAATSDCTAHLATHLAALGIPATYRSRPGTHTWAYWQDDLHSAWPTLAAALG